MSSPLTHGGRDARKAFTLIELLTVIAIIGVLAGITFGVVRGVGEQGKISRATAELASLDTAMEEYKRYFGDYPWVGNDTNDNEVNPAPNNRASTDRAYNLFRALGGRFTPRQNIAQRQIDINGNMRDKYAKTFIDFSLFTLERAKVGDDPSGAPFPVPETNPTSPDPDFVNALLDPWGNRYLYYYRDVSSPNTWKRPGYVLYSAGPDGQASAPTGAGVLPGTTGVDADNIYSSP